MLLTIIHDLPESFPRSIWLYSTSYPTDIIIHRGQIDGNLRVMVIIYSVQETTYCLLYYLRTQQWPSLQENTNQGGWAGIYDIVMLVATGVL
jgi:hypothetical protein